VIRVILYSPHVGEEKKKYYKKYLCTKRKTQIQKKKKRTDLFDSFNPLNISNSLDYPRWSIIRPGGPVG
jgi:hypothetical protein